MLTRRDALIGAMCAGGLMRTRTSFGKAAQPATAVNFDVPADACDCHTHIHGDPEKFPFFAGRVYTPETALPEEMAALRGVAVIDDKTPDADLDAMGKAGVRGIRLNLATGGSNDPALARKRFEAALPRMASRNWHIQIYTNLAVIAAIKDQVLASPVPVVLDHFGGAQAALGPTQPGFPDLVELVRSGKAYVKISGAYRASTQAPDYPDAAPLAKALIAANADRLVWGTDWPHPNSTTPPGGKVTDVTPLFQIDDGRLLNQLPVWAPDAKTRKAILVDNPARLYQF